MSYQDQAEKINEVFKRTFPEWNDEKKKELVDTILRFGQVAKYRCRGNTAYDNFSKIVFKDIAELERQQVEGQEFEALMVKK